MSCSARSSGCVAARHRSGWLVAALLLVASCVDEPILAPARSRQGRLGSLRDLVLIERPTSRQPADGLFVDRFEVTAADWTEFAKTAQGRAVGADAVAVSADPAMPVAGIDLAQARAFARWRCLRLPTRAEWDLVTTGAGRSEFPWGDQPTASRANTGELGLLTATAVGTFESGRRAGGDQPYDLIGNVSEWTESVPPRWVHDEWDALAAVPRLRDALLRRRALAVWAPAPGVLPPGWIAHAGGANVPHEVVGSDFQTPMRSLVEVVLAGDRRQRTGLRLYGGVGDLVNALCNLPGEPVAAEVDQVRSFVLRDGHRDALVGAFARLQPRPDTAFARLLARELGFAPEAAR